MISEGVDYPWREYDEHGRVPNTDEETESTGTYQNFPGAVRTHKKFAASTDDGYQLGILATMRVSWCGESAGNIKRWTEDASKY